MHEIFTVYEGISFSSVSKSHLLQINNSPKNYAHKQRKSYQIGCGFPNGKTDYKHLVKISTWNNPDRRLPRPLNISSNLTISCKIPRSAQIYLWRPHEAVHTVNTIKASGYEFINLKNRHHHYFQLFAFDNEAKPFYNFSSLAVGWTLDRKEHASLSSM